MLMPKKSARLLNTKIDEAWVTTFLKLNSILTRLNKLNIIENSVRNIKSNLVNLKARKAKLEVFEIVAKKDIKDVK